MKSTSKRCGTKIYKGLEIPINAEIHTHQGRECYLTGIELGTISNDWKGTTYEVIRIVRYIDTGEIARYKKVESTQKSAELVSK